jgi:hypothetical protein
MSLLKKFDTDVFILIMRFFWQLAVIVPWTIVGWHLAIDILQ